MQIYGIRMFNFFRFGEDCNSIVFDVSPDNMKKLADEDDPLTMDMIYDELKSNPVAYINDVKERGIADLLAVCGVKGDNYDRSNGVGKSTIFEAICYAHYDRVVRRSVNTDKSEKAGTSVVTRFNGKYPESLKESYVEEIFEENGKIYRVKRGRAFTGSQKSHSPIVEFECINENDVESREGHRTTDTNEAIAQVTPWDYDIFVNGAMFAQNDAGKFLMGTDKTRKEMLISLLNLEDVVIACLESIRARKNKKSKEVDTLSAQINILKDNLEAYGTIEEIEQRIKDYQKVIFESDKKTKAINDKIEELSKSDAVKKVASLKEDGSRVKSEIEQQEEQRKSQIKEWESLKDDSIKKGKGQKSKLESLVDKREKIRLEEKKKESWIKAFDMTSREEDLKKIEKSKNVKDAYVEKSKELRKQKENLLEETAKHKSEISRLSSEISSLSEQLSNSSGEEFICEKCKSNVSRHHIESEISKNKDVVSKHNLENEKLNKEQKRVVEKLEESERRLDIINEWLIKESKIKSEIKEYNDTKKALEDIKKQSKEDNAESIKELTQEIKDIKVQIVEYNEKIDGISKKYDSKSKELKVNLDEIAEKYREAKKDAEGVESTIKSLKNKGEEVSAEKSKADSNIGSAKKDIDNIKSASKKIKELEDDLTNDRQVFNRLVILEDVFGLEGIQTRIVKKYLPLLNVYIKEFLDIFSNGEMSVELFINDRSKVDINITGGSADTYIMLSGGEKVLVKLSVDIGLALLAFSRCTQKPEVIFLDEIFGSLDDFNIHAVFKLINNLKGRFSRVILISHKREINDSIPNKIFIEKDEGDFGRSKFRYII